MVIGTRANSGSNSPSVVMARTSLLTLIVASSTTSHAERGGELVRLVIQHLDGQRDRTVCDSRHDGDKVRAYLEHTASFRRLVRLGCLRSDDELMVVDNSSPGLFHLWNLSRRSRSRIQHSATFLCSVDLTPSLLLQRTLPNPACDRALRELQVVSENESISSAPCDAVLDVAHKVFRSMM